MKKLRGLSGLRDEIEKEISETFTHDKDMLLVSLESVKQGRVMDKTEPFSRTFSTRRSLMKKW